jgi:glycosyltransferase involved in cell wall biosynthesis
MSGRSIVHQAIIDKILPISKSSRAPFLSLIIPAYNEAARLPETLTQVSAFLEKQDYRYEILVVENGSTDGTYETALSFTGRIPNLSVRHEEIRGKGWAVRQGMLTARGDWRFICDADLSMPIEEINRFLPPRSEATISIGSREAPGAVRYDEPEFRHLTGRAFNLMVRLLLLPGLQDTQCGFKCFRADAAQKIFPLVTIPGWTFDVEALFIARRLGFVIDEIPIPWHYKALSRVKVARDSLQMAADLMRIRWNAWMGVYGG